MRGLTKIITILFLGTAVSVLLYGFVVSPLLSEVNIINADVRTKKIELAVLQRQITAFKTAQSDLAKATRKDEIINAIPEREDLVVTVLDLERAAAATNSIHTLQIIENNPKDKKVPTAVVSKKVGIDEVPYNLKLTNDFMGTVNFINYLENLPHFTEIGKIHITSEQTQVAPGIVARTGVVGVDINGVFFIKQKQRK